MSRRIRVQQVQPSCTFALATNACATTTQCSLGFENANPCVHIDFTSAPGLAKE